MIIFAISYTFLQRIRYVYYRIKYAKRKLILAMAYLRERGHTDYSG